MDFKEAVLTALKELVLPELHNIKQEQGEFKVTLGLTNKRLDDLNAHLVDQSRRIDETNNRIDKIHIDLLNRIDETNKRLDQVSADLGARIDKVNTDLVARIDKVNTDLVTRIDETNKRLDQVSAELGARIDKINTDLVARIDETNRNIARLYEVIVRRDEHQQLLARIIRLEQEVGELKQRLAA